VVLTHIDGEQSSDEVELIQHLRAYLRIESPEADAIVAAAEARVKRLLEATA
jgi:hypothetical protein